MNCKRKYILKKHAESMEKKKNDAIDKLPKDESLGNDKSDKGGESSFNS